MRRAIINMKNKFHYVLRWGGLGTGAVYTVFISLFALDAGSVAGTLIHLTPSFLIAVVVVIGYSNALLGGILAGIAGAAFTMFFHTYKNLEPFLLISMPLFAVSALFVLSAMLENNRFAPTELPAGRHG
jgi:hypothetical protein